MFDETGASRPLGSILLLEDEALVSMMIEDIMREAGAREVHVFSDPELASDAATTLSLDCAILDVFIRGTTSAEIADILAARGVPFIFSTGAGPEAVAERHRNRPILTKPFAEADLRECLRQALSPAP